MFLQVQLTINALATYQRKHNMSELMTVEALEPIQHEELHDTECYSDVITPVSIIPLIVSFSQQHSCILNVSKWPYDRWALKAIIQCDTMLLSSTLEKLSAVTFD